MTLSKYESDINKFISINSAGQIAQAIRMLVNYIHKNPDKHQDKTFREHLPASFNGGLIGPANFKNITIKTIINSIITNHDLDRAIVFYKLWNKDLSPEEIGNKLKFIKEEKTYPSAKRGTHTELGKYRSLGNIFQLAEQIPREETLKLCIVILDLSVHELSEYIEKMTNSENLPEYKKAFSFFKRKNFLLIGTLLTLIFAGLGIFYFDRFSQEITSDQLNQEVRSSEIFDVNVPIDTIEFIDKTIDISVSKTEPLGAASIANGAIIPIDSCMVRFMIKNPSPEYLFPDNFLLEFENTNIQLSSSTLISNGNNQRFSIFFFDADLVYNKLSIMNDKKFPYIKPNSIAIGTLTIKNKRPGKNELVNVKLTLTAHSKNVDQISITSQESIVIFLSN